MRLWLGFLVGAVVMLALKTSGTADQVDQLKADRATVQQQIAAEQTRTRQLEVALQQLLTQQAQTSASITQPEHVIVDNQPCPGGYQFC